MSPFRAFTIGMSAGLPMGVLGWIFATPLWLTTVVSFVCGGLLVRLLMHIETMAAGGTK